MRLVLVELAYHKSHGSTYERNLLHQHIYVGGTEVCDAMQDLEEETELLYTVNLIFLISTDVSYYAVRYELIVCLT